MTLVVRRSRAVLAVLVVAAIAAALLVVGAAKSSQALNGKVLILDTTLSTSDPVNEQTQAATLGLGADVVTPEQWAAMTADQFAQYDAIVLGDNHCEEGVDSADVLEAPLANLATWIPAVSGNIFFSTSDAVYHANEGDNEAGATLQITKGLAYAAGAGTTGLYFTSSCYGDEDWVGILDAFSPGWSAVDDSADDIHVTGSAALLMGLDDANLVDYDNSVHHIFESWASDFTVYAIATDINEGGSDAANGNGNAGATDAGIRRSSGPSSGEGRPVPSPHPPRPSSAATRARRVVARRSSRMAQHSRQPSREEQEFWDAQFRDPPRPRPRRGLRSHVASGVVSIRAVARCS